VGYFFKASIVAALFSSSLLDFCDADPNATLGVLTKGLAQEGFDNTSINVGSWVQEISELQVGFRCLAGQLATSRSWHVLLEYILPVVGQRLDCVLIADDVIYVIEYKQGSSTTASAALRQAQDYALNLADFHEESRGRVVVPIALGGFKTCNPLDLQKDPQHGASASPGVLSETVISAQNAWGGEKSKIDSDAWDQSRYFPVPTIIEAASDVYLNHDVKELASSRSGSENLTVTQDAIMSAVREAMKHGAHKLIIVTGVPGAGKTLAGLDIVQKLQKDLHLDTEQASFLSGNGPLVKVLQEALKRSIGRRQAGVARSIRSRISEIHRFARDSYADNQKRPPANRLIVFDEAQRAWTAAKNFKKFGYDLSEPEMILEIMARHKGWAVVVALVGGGQEIHGGEAGLAAWGDALLKHPHWKVTASPEASRGGPAVAGSRLFRSSSPKSLLIEENQALHLAISKRSFETEVTAAWVNDLLEGKHEECAALAAKGLPIWITRNIDEARHWLRDRSTGFRRAGLMASSGAARLRAEGVEAPTFSFLGGIDYTKWFLNPVGDYRSSNQLEVALSEFEMQGLEVDLVGLLWGGDLLFQNNKVVTRRLGGEEWKITAGTGDAQDSADDPRTRILNKYRVLLTRFRKGMVIFVPVGSSEDSTRHPDDFDSIFNYLIRCGVKPL
jgi:Schlafen group 3, DNA/RNA helicase domain